MTPDQLEKARRALETKTFESRWAIPFMLELARAVLEMQEMLEALAIKSGRDGAELARKDEELTRLRAVVEAARGLADATGYGAVRSDLRDLRQALAALDRKDGT